MTIAHRHVLPARRGGETFEMVYGGSRFTVTVGYFPPPSRSIGEVFVHGHKTGTDLEGIARDAAVILSIALQYGVPLAILQAAVTRTAGDQPQSIMGAIIDRLAREEGGSNGAGIQATGNPARL